MRVVRILTALVSAALAIGCNVGVTESDTAKVREEFSQAKYEEAMKAAGKGDQLEAEKAAAAERGDQ